MNRDWNHSLLCVLALLLTACSGSSQVPWTHDHESAFEEAEKTDQPVLVYLYTDWCTYCRQMEATTLKDPRVVRNLTNQFVLLKLNAEEDPEGIRYREEFQVFAYPTFLLMTPDQMEIDRLQGYVPAEDFVSSLQTRLTAPDAFVHVRKEAQEKPTSAQAQYRLAQKYLDRGQTARASRQLMKVIELDPENRAGHSDDSLYRLAEILASEGAPEDALLAVQSLRKKYPDGSALADATLLEAELLIEKGEDDRVRTILEQFLRNYPEHESVDRVRDYLEPSGSLTPATSH